MKIKGRASHAWHQNIDNTVGTRKPTDADFPWIALQNHTGYYLKKKGTLSQTQIDERLTALVKIHPSKEVALAACAQSLSVCTIRTLLSGDWAKHKSDNATALDEYLQAIVATNHVNPEAVGVIEAKWAVCLLEQVTAGGSSHNFTLGQQLRDILPLLSYQANPHLLLHAEFLAHGHGVCLNHASQLEHLRLECQWMDAHSAIEWLSASDMLHSGAIALLDHDLPTWRAWATWRPQLVRIRAWKKYIVHAPTSLKDLFALEGPDFASVIGSERATLRDGLIEQCSRGSQSVLHWKKLCFTFRRNPFITSENLNGILERLISIIDFACLAGADYTALLEYTLVGKIINNESLQILEGVRLLRNPALTTVILQVFRSEVGQEIGNIKQLMPALNDPNAHSLREQLKPHLVDRISYHVRELQNMLVVQIDAGKQWDDAARRLVTLTCALNREAWLLGELDHSVRQSIVLGPPIAAIETLCIIRNSIRSSTSSTPTPLMSHLSAYCKMRLLPHHDNTLKSFELIEVLTVTWQQALDENRQRLALLIADLPETSLQFICGCLKDIPTLSASYVSSTLEMLNFHNRGSYMDIITLVRLLTSEIGQDSLMRWRHVLLYAIQKKHEVLIQLCVVHMTAKQWLELLDGIRMIYQGSGTIKQDCSIKLLSLELHLWSQQLADHLPALTRLESAPESVPAMQMLKLGSSATMNSQRLRILGYAKLKRSIHHERLNTTIIGLLPSRNTRDIEDVLLALSKAGSNGAEACVSLLDAKQHTSTKFAEAILAIRLRASDSDPDRDALKAMAKFLRIRLDTEGNPSAAGLEEAADSVHKQCQNLMTEARRLESLRLSLKAVAPGRVSELLARLHIETPSVVDDALALLPASLGSLFETISENEIELQFPMTDLSSLQRFAIGAGDSEMFLVRLTLSSKGIPIKFCIHLSGESNDQTHAKGSSKWSAHNPWEVFRGNRSPHEQYCHDRPNRGNYQFSRIIWFHLRHKFHSLAQTHAYLSSKISKFGQGCVVCGVGQRRLRRATTCPLQTCQRTFSQAHIEIQLAEIWQDPPVMDLLLIMIHSVASTGKLDLLANFPAKDPSTIISLLDNVPTIQALAKHLKSCLHVSDEFSLAKAVSGYCTSSSDHYLLASSLLWACTSHRSFIVSATGPQRIPSFGNNQFLLANSAPGLETAFSAHMPTPQSSSQILFHGTSLDRLHAIICQGLCVQSGTALQRHGAVHGAGIYMADEPTVAWGYSTACSGGWKSSNLKNTKVLLGCELAGAKPPAVYGGIYVITDATKLAVRYIFLLASNARIPAAKDVTLPMGSVFQRLRSGTL